MFKTVVQTSLMIAGIVTGAHEFVKWTIGFDGRGHAALAIAVTMVIMYFAYDYCFDGVVREMVMLSYKITLFVALTVIIALLGFGLAPALAVVTLVYLLIWLTRSEPKHS